VNTVVEEPKTKASEQITSHDIQIRQAAASAIPQSLKPENTSNQPKENRHASCLESAALFLGRG
jgi:hypothetical protein